MRLGDWASACARTLAENRAGTIAAYAATLNAPPMPLAADYPFMDVFWTIVIFFCWVAWIWVLVLVLMDVFGRDDISGWGKAGWVVLMLVLPFVGVLVYLVAHGSEIGERRARRFDAEYEARHRAGASGGGDGAASQIADAKRLLDSGAITQAEFDQLKAKALA